MLLPDAMTFALLIAAAALAVEGVVGYPQWIFRVIGHPVTWIGRVIGWCDATLNRPEVSHSWRRVLGILGLFIVLTLTGGVALAVTHIAIELPHVIGTGLLILVASSLIAQRGLDRHVVDVAQALETSGVDAGRAAVGQIVGRDTGALDSHGTSRAAIESLAENYADGVVAPTLWMVLGGLVGGALYKAINTADSMIGHRNERHLAFGWASARLDDLANFPAARLAAVFIVCSAFMTRGASAADAIRAVRSDARHHASPNAGWPEAAMAGALGLRLAGPRAYDGVATKDAWMGDGRAEASAADIRRAVTIYRRACVIEFVVVATLAAALTLRG